MKLPYMKPEFGQVLLNEGTTKTRACNIGVNHEWLECGIPIAGTWDPEYNSQYIIFSDEPVCNTDFEGNAYICYFNGANYSVFGS